MLCFERQTKLATQTNFLRFISPNYAVSIGTFVLMHLICQQRILLSRLLISSGLASEFGMCHTEENAAIWMCLNCDFDELCTMKSDT